MNMQDRLFNFIMGNRAVLTSFRDAHLSSLFGDEMGVSLSEMGVARQDSAYPELTLPVHQMDVSSYSLTLSVLSVLSTIMPTTLVWITM